jgi:hypothetical protein
MMERRHGVAYGDSEEANPVPSDKADSKDSAYRSQRLRAELMNSAAARLVHELLHVSAIGPSPELAKPNQDKHYCL